MKTHFEMIRHAIDTFDEDPTKSMFFYNHSPAKAKMFQDILSYAVAHLENITEPTANNQRAQEIIKWLDNNYQGYEWPVHEVHFHTNFYGFITCPFTCLNEISSTLEKLIKEKFAA